MTPHDFCLVLTKCFYSICKKGKHYASQGWEIEYVLISFKINTIWESYVQMKVKSFLIVFFFFFTCLLMFLFFNKTSYHHISLLTDLKDWIVCVKVIFVQMLVISMFLLFWYIKPKSKKNGLITVQVTLLRSAMRAQTTGKRYPV